ncbi:MAG: hypothetical protein ACK520_10495 [Inhella sp.]
MGIWLDQLERESLESRALTQQQLRDRHNLRTALEEAHDAVVLRAGEDTVLLLLDVHLKPEPNGAAAPLVEGQELTYNELVRMGLPVYALRDGQACVLLRGASNEAVKTLLARLTRRVSDHTQGRFGILFGAARASEARRSCSDWMTLADLRFQARQSRLAATASVASSVLARRAERRRTGQR